ncbi:hypothetical protein DERP_009993 [Dermatophagoides pteronyssinus]|uniref:Uncharacterized protein n=1 Tax=Dermatophagoides pteronyssinus TaxID=6956 RepID=A0ABQ8J238_DERPT|nr:hypothetical protein DERP_009993 [Dermatophagoides pteronyssinus]
MKEKKCKIYWSRIRGAQIKHIKRRVRKPYLERIHPELSFLDDELPKSTMQLS